MLAGTRGSYGGRQREAGTGSSYGPSSTSATSAASDSQRWAAGPGAIATLGARRMKVRTAGGFVALS